MSPVFLKNRNSQGFTLLQLLSVVGLAAILTSIAVPSYSTLVSRTQIRTAGSVFRTAIETARTAAISHASTVTLCRSVDGASCSGQWHEGLLVFTDSNANRVVDSDDSVLLHSQAISGYTVRWRSFGNRQYLQFTPRGLVLFQNGNFQFCPASPDSGNEAAQVLIINATGRVRAGIDLNGNGIAEDSQGEDLDCSQS